MVMKEMAPRAMTFSLSERFLPDIVMGACLMKMTYSHRAAKAARTTNEVGCMTNETMVVVIMTSR
jgi:hypothetical protein